MALNATTMKTALNTKLTAIFQQMQSAPAKNDAWFADQLSSAIADTVTDQIKTAGIPASSVIVSVTGQATGTPNPSPILVT